MGGIAGLVVILSIYVMTASHSSSHALAMPPDRELPIAMFDSGVGGLTVLHECLVSLPSEDFLYLGDTAHFPYGTKTAAELRDLVARNTGMLLDRGAKLLIVACNSATSAGADAARRDRRRARGRGRDGDRPRGRDRSRDHRDRPGRRARHARDRRRRRLPPRPGAPGPGPGGDRGVGSRPRRRSSRAASRSDEEVVEKVRFYCAPLQPGRGRHADPRLHPLPAGRADAAADARARRPPGHRRARDRRHRAAPARVAGARVRERTGRASTASSARATSRASASSAPASCRCRSARSRVEL